MKLTVSLTFDIDLTAWAGEYGLSDSEAGPDAVNAVTTAVNDGSLAAAIVTAWPSIGNLATVTTSVRQPATARRKDRL